MPTQTLLLWLLVGAAAGWMAGVIVKGRGIGVIPSIVVGIIGSFIGGWLFNHFNISTGGGLFGAIIGAAIGAVILLFAIRLIRRR
jgi:uncharacterized membrane protein YeaQ/YmgE (transglycosylase-associated protein family)